MRKFGLIGYPLGHSFSKGYFLEKFHNEHITDCTYENFPLKDITELRKLIIENPDLCGLNVTIPHKSEVIKLLDRISPEAKEIGAVNVIKIKRTRYKTELSGFNSDIKGISDSLSPFLTGEIRNAIVLGTGGSSHAVCYVLEKLGLDITLVSRTSKPGMITYKDIDQSLMAKVGLVINTTPLGMFPDIETMPDIDYSLLSDRHILFDLVYNPQQTQFLRKGLEQGCITVSGINMLYSQAERAWEIWNDENL